MTTPGNLPRMLVAGFEAHARVYAERLKQLEDASLNEIDGMLAQCQHPYVALSGGKDSMLMLYLVRQIKPDIECIWVDEWDTPDTWALLDWVEREWGNKVWRVRHKYHPEFFARYGEHPVLNQPCRIDWHLEHYGDLPPLGFDGVFVGMRRDESKKRDWALRHQKTQYLKYRQILRCAPLGDWRLYDAWAYTIAKGLPVHPAYARQLEMGIPLERARVGGLTIIRLIDLGTGAKHKYVDPAEWQAMLIANPCMRRDS